MVGVLLQADVVDQVEGSDGMSEEPGFPRWRYRVPCLASPAFPQGIDLLENFKGSCG